MRNWDNSARQLARHASNRVARGSIRSVMHVRGALSVLLLVAVPLQPVTRAVKQIDHVMFVGGPELSGLVSILRDRFELPVVFDGPSQTPPSPGTCLSFGNVCLEVT